MTSSKAPFPFLTLILALGTGCGGGGSSSGNSGNSNISTHNVLLISVNGSSLNQAYGINAATVSVTVCSPGTTVCQTIDNILLDTGSSGLRIFKQALTITLTQQTIGGNPLAECMLYDDGTSDWGPVQVADVILGVEPAVRTQIQVIDATFGNIPSICAPPNATPDASPSNEGYNGILGVGLFAQNCGSACQDNVITGWYYACNGSTCNATAVPVNDQLQNPVALLPKDNNGLIAKLPSISADEVASASGSLLLGIDTKSNNIPPSTVTTYPVDDTTGNFTTTFNGISYTDSFIDTGSNALFFPSTLKTNSAGWFIPNSITSFSATTSGYNGTPSNVISFQLGNYDILVTNSSNWVFNDIGGTGVNEFEWGLPFYFGRDVYHGIEGRSSSLGTGPYWAY
jgi:hypothetical protein